MKVISRSLPEPNQRLRWGVSSAGGPSHCFFSMPERFGCMAKDPLLKRSRSLREPNQPLRWGVSSAGGPSHCFCSLRRRVERPTLRFQLQESLSPLSGCISEGCKDRGSGLRPAGASQGPSNQGPPSSRGLPKASQRVFRGLNKRVAQKRNFEQWPRLNLLKGPWSSKEGRSPESFQRVQGGLQGGPSLVRGYF